MGEIIMDGDFNDVMLNQDRVSKITNSKPQRIYSYLLQASVEMIYVLS